jgi:hypothetical protein
MSCSVSTLLTRNFQDVFGEDDPARRRAAINEIFTENCVFYDPKRGRLSWPRRDGSYRGKQFRRLWAPCGLAAKLVDLKLPSKRRIVEGKSVALSSSTPFGKLYAVTHDPFDVSRCSKGRISGQLTVE